MSGHQARRARPAALALFLALLAAALFVALGSWQWQRGTARQQQWQRFEQGARQVLPLEGATEQLPLYQRVQVHGRLDGEHQFLLDNRSHREQPGYEVLTPLQRPGRPALLIDRGWLPLGGSRRQLPDVRIGSNSVSLSGRLALLPSPGLAFGRAPPSGAWPKLTSFPSMAQLERAYDAPLEPRILLLDPQAPEGYVREWHAPGLAPLRHFAYALQWWSFAAATLVILTVLTLRRRRP